MGSKLKTHGANEITNILNNEQIERLQIKFIQCTVQHHRIQVTFTARVDLHGGRSCCSSSISINAGGNIPINNSQLHLIAQPLDHMLN